MIKVTRRSGLCALASYIFITSALYEVPAIAQDPISQYESLLRDFREWKMSAKEFEARKRELVQRYGIQIDTSGKASLPQKTTASPPPAQNSSDIAPGMPACNSPAVKEKVLQAIYRDLAKLKVPMTSMGDVEAAANSLAPSSTPQGRQSRLNISRVGRVPMDHVSACEPTAGIPLGVVVVMDPRKQSRWGVLVVNYGIPNRAANLDLEFMD